MAVDLTRPLADRMRPRSLEEFVGQVQAVGPGKPLRAAIESGQTHSLILWGPPGTGKTTLARLIAQASDVTAVLVLPTEQGYAIDLSVPEERINRDRMARRSLEGRTGCGLCGIEDMKDAIRMPSRQLPAVALAPQAVARAYEQLPAHQPMSRVNRTVHAAAWCSVDGDILLSREDVGRHNALDKLIGALAREGRDLSRVYSVAGVTASTC